MSDDDREAQAYFGVWYPLVKLVAYVIATTFVCGLLGLGCGVFFRAFNAVAPGAVHIENGGATRTKPR